MTNKKFIIILLVLVIIALVGLVWSVMRAPVVTDPNSTDNASDGLPVGDLNQMPDPSLTGTVGGPSLVNEEDGGVLIPSGNTRLEQLTTQTVADVWLIGADAYYLTRRSAETFTIPLIGGEALASTTAIRPSKNYTLPNIQPFSLFTNWQSTLINPTTALVQTKPTQAGAGAVLMVNTKTGTARRVLGGQSGLSAIASPDGQTLLYSALGLTGLELNLLNLKNQQVSSLPLFTIADKCLFASDALVYCAVPRTQSFVGYPDTWYRGEVFSSDQIWSVNTQTLETKLVFEGLLGNTQFDIINLAASSNGEWLVFMTKGDWRGWKFDLKEELGASSTTTPAQ